MVREFCYSIVLFLFAGVGTAQAITIYVPDDYSTIQDAIAAASGGDTVVVRSGTWTENIDFMGKAITVTSESGPANTIIDGNQTGSVVYFGSGEGGDSVIEGFTITNGSGTYYPTWSVYFGGGIFCNASSPTIRRNLIAGNSAGGSGGGADGDGGGIECAFVASPLIEENEIATNQADWGGAIDCIASSCPSIVNNTLRDNGADEGGGAVSCDGSSPRITGNLITGNSAPLGGALYGYTASPLLTNNTIVANSAGTGGGGIFLDLYSFSTVANTILWDNDAPAGSEIYLDGTAAWPSEMTLKFSVVKDPPASLYVDPDCTLNWGAGMLIADPLFVDSTEMDFHLTWNSPCRNAGTTNTPPPPDSDFEGDPRIALGKIDIGSDEFYYHLYRMGAVIPGNQIAIKAVGGPAMRVTLYLGSGIQDPPQPSAHGDIYLELPVVASWNLGKTQATGIVTLTTTVPLTWNPGEEYPFQALIGVWGDPYTQFSNLMVLHVE